MKRLPTYSASLIILFCSCSTKQQDERLCENQVYLTTTLTHSFLAKNRGHGLIIFRTYKGNKTNQYVIDVKEEVYTLNNDSIEYLQTIPLLKKNPSAYVRQLDSKLNSIGIREYDGEPDGLGTLLKLYMSSGNVIFKAESVEKITYPETLKVLKESKKICGDWYISPE